MRALMRVGGVIFGVVAGGTVGGLIGWALGDFGGRFDPENVWFLCLIVGAAVGLAFALALILRRAGRRSWGFSLLLGTVSSIVTAAVVALFVAWQRHP
jgi:membrane protein YqaA with SNARE-associated domain